MRDRDILQLICRPGFSTAEKITATSGRGVGMDVVKMAVDGLGGSLEICSQPDAGTRIELRLPLSVAIIQVLLVQVDGHQVGIPITRVERILSLTREQIQSSGRKLVFRLDDEAVPLLSLRKILQLPGRALRGPVSVVLTAVGGRRVGLVVDALCGQREAFVKSLAYPLNQIAGVSGASILGDGSVLFLIDPQQLLDERPAARTRQAAGAEA
jgi:two-component system chemotaxis sensor kinase CheA